MKKGFTKLSLTQQVMCLILLMVAFLILFFLFFLSGNIQDTINTQIYDMIAARQQPVVEAMNMGKQLNSDMELFNYLTADSNITTMVVTPDTVDTLSQPQRNPAPEFGRRLAQAAQKIIGSDIDVTQGINTFRGEVFYYRLEQTDYNRRPAVVVSYMDDTYAINLRSTLMDSTIYITVLAFFLVLMILLFWVFSIIHPLNQIKAYITQIKEGKDVDLYINREDEIGEVAQELRTLTAELAKQEKAKEEMIHNISHDLKTPIATIKSYSESIKDGIFPYGNLESSVDVILDNAKRLEDKVHSLLYMNRVEYLVSSDSAGVVTNMKDVVEQVVLNAAVIRPEIKLITDVDEVYFDGLLESWRVCLENIMENAFRYAKSYIRIEVRDNDLRVYNDGPKMPEDRIQSLFLPYIKGEGGRFGLGLSIVSKVVQANRYKVEGLNTDQGVCFHIWRDTPKKKNQRSNYRPSGHWSSARRTPVKGGEAPKAGGAEQNQTENEPKQKKEEEK